MAGNGEAGATSETLSVESATPVFLGLLSREEEPQTRETPPTQESPESEPVEETEASSEQAEESEGETAETEESEEQSEEQDEKPATYRVKVDGEEIEVTLEELQKGYSRTADYTRKTQQLAEERKKFEAAELPAVRAERERLAAYLGQLEQAIVEATPKEPDWAKLQQEADPAEFAATWAQWQQHKQQLDSLRGERQRAEQQVLQDRAQALHGYLDGERQKLFEAIPDWKDATKAKAEKTEMVQFAKSAGYTDEELGQVTDHRVLVLLRKAMLYDKAQKAKPGVRQTIEKVKAATPGPSKGNAGKKVSESTRALQRLAKTHRADDAAGVFFHMLQEEGKKS